MKVIFFKITFIGIIVFSSFSHAQYTEVSGSQSGTWGVENSPYLVVDNILVNPGDTLEIEPGVEVVYDSAYAILVLGTILANGTPNDSIIFRHVNPSEYHHGIDIYQSTAVSKFNYCRVQDGDANNTNQTYPLNRFGGAIFLFESDAEISNCYFTRNKAWYGGAVAVCFSCTTLIERSVFRNNYADHQGGAITCYGGAGSATPLCTIKNNIIQSNVTNTSIYGGGGISVYRNADADIINNVIVDNHAVGYGGGIGLLTSENINSEIVFADIINNILWNNTQTRTSSTGSTQIDTLHFIGACSLTVNYCNCEGGFDGAGNIDLDPLFLDADNYDFHLSNGSPCIDTGTDLNAPTVDADGNATNQDGDNSGSNEHDMGAFEFLQVVHVFNDADSSQSFSLDTYEEGIANLLASLDISGITTGEAEMQLVCYTKSIPLDFALPSRTIHRWYTINEDGDLSYDIANLRLYYGDQENPNDLNLDTLILWRNNGIAWNEFEGTVIRGVNYLQVDSLTQTELSGAWAIVESGEPSAVSNDKNIYADTYLISENYPNPFNPLTQIDLMLPQNTDIRFEIVNSIGQKIYSKTEKNVLGKKTLVWNAYNVSTGIYFYRIFGKINNGSNQLLKTGKMVVLK